MATYFLYTTILAVVSSSGYIAEHGNTPLLRLNARVVCFFTMLIPAILRYAIGTDYLGYVNIYAHNLSIEPGFMLIGALCHAFDLSAWWFFAITSTMTYYLVCFLLPRKHLFFILTFYVLFFCYLNSYNIIRQLLATSFLLCGLSFYQEHRIKSILFFLASVLFHYSSIIILPCLIFCGLFGKIKFNLLQRIFFVLLCVAVIFTLDFESIVLSIITKFIPRYREYSSLFAKSGGIHLGMGMMITMSLPVIVIFNSVKMSKIPNGAFFINCNIFYLLLWCLIITVPPFGRLGGVVVFIPLLSLGMLFESNKKYSNIYYYALLTIYTMLYFYMIGTSTQGTASAGINPYTSIFDMASFVKIIFNNR